MAHYNVIGNELWIEDGEFSWQRGIFDYVLSANKIDVVMDGFDSVLITITPLNTGICKVYEVDTDTLLDERKVNAGESFAFEYMPDEEGRHLIRVGEPDLEFNLRLNEVYIVCRGV